MLNSQKYKIMQTKIALLGCIICSFHFNACATEMEKLDENIIEYFQRTENLVRTPFPALAFGMPELIFVLQNDSIFSKWEEWKTGRLAWLKDNAQDVYLATLLQIEFFKKSLTTHHSINENDAIKRLINALNVVPTHKLQEQDMYLFFKSFTDESGVGALKIETLLIIQNLDMVFNYIENNEYAKERFLKWVDEEIEVWCPILGSDNQVLSGRVAKHMYNRLNENNSALAQQAAKRMKEWFGY